MNKGRLGLVLISGAPGVGKTIFSTNFCRKWTQGEEEALQQFSMVVFLPLRDNQVQSAKTISDLFYQSPQSVEITDEVVQDVERTKGEGVLFLLDGWDELDHAKSSIFMSLIKKTALSKATVFVTSRPWASREIAEKMLKKDDLHIEILSSPKIQLDRVLKERKWDHSVSNGFKKYLSSNVAVNAAMHAYIVADIAADVFEWSLGANPPLTLPTTITQLYTMYICNLLTKHLVPSSATKTVKDYFEDLPDDVKEQFSFLCEIAYDGLSNRKLVFNDLSPDLQSYGLMRAAKPPLIGEKSQPSYHFIHLSVQEYLAAYHITQLPASNQAELFKKHRQHSSDMFGHFKETLRFVAGLNSLKSIIEDQEQIMQLLQSDQLTLIHWLFETANSEVVSTILKEGVEVRIHTSYSWNPLDFYLIGYCLSISNCPWCLEFSELIGDTDELEMFSQGVNTYIK